MDDEIRPRRTSMSWNAGGWFGAQLGCSLWLIIVGIVFLPGDRGFGWACIAAGVLLNLWGLLLWSQRSRVRPYIGIQLFLALVAVVNIGVILMARSGGAEFQTMMAHEVKAAFPYWAVFVAPACMALMYLVDRRARKHR